MVRSRIAVALVFLLVTRLAAAPGDPAPYCAVGGPTATVSIPGMSCFICVWMRTTSEAEWTATKRTCGP